MLSILEIWIFGIFVVLIVTGISFNSIVMRANGGKMPVDADSVSGEGYVPINEFSRFTFLADIFHGKVPFRGDVIYSIGDVFINAGKMLGLILVAVYLFLVLKDICWRLIY